MSIIITKMLKLNKENKRCKLCGRYKGITLCKVCHNQLKEGRLNKYGNNKI